MASRTPEYLVYSLLCTLIQVTDFAPNVGPPPKPRYILLRGYHYILSEALHARHEGRKATLDAFFVVGVLHRSSKAPTDSGAAHKSLGWRRWTRFEGAGSESHHQVYRGTIQLETSGRRARSADLQHPVITSGLEVWMGGWPSVRPVSGREGEHG